MKKASSKGRWVIGMIVVVIFIAAIIAGVLCMGFASRNEAGKWFSNGNLSTWHWADMTPEEKDPNEKDPNEKDPNEGEDPGKDPGKDPNEGEDPGKDPDEKDPNEGEDPGKDPNEGEDPAPVKYTVTYASGAEGATGEAPAGGAFKEGAVITLAESAFELNGFFLRVGATA